MRPALLRPLPLLAIALLLGGCGGDSERQPPRPGVGTSLDADNLAVVHDELYACLRRALPDVLLANYLAGQASITNRLAKSSFDERLAAPRAERELLDSGGAEFIGVRANRSLPRWQAVPEWDLLILPTRVDAGQAAAQIRAGAAQDGIFVRVVKRAGSGGRARAAEAALTRCLDASRRG